MIIRERSANDTTKQFNRMVGYTYTGSKRNALAVKANSSLSLFNFADSRTNDELATLGLDIIRLSSLILWDIGRTHSQVKEESHLITQLSNAIFSLPHYIKACGDATEEFEYIRDNLVIEILHAFDLLRDIYFGSSLAAYHFKSKPMTEGFESFAELLRMETMQIVTPY